MTVVHVERTGAWRAQLAVASKHDKLAIASE